MTDLDFKSVFLDEPINFFCGLKIAVVNRNVKDKLIHSHFDGSVCCF